MEQSKLIEKNEDFSSHSEMNDDSEKDLTSNLQVLGFDKLLGIGLVILVGFSETSSSVCVQLLDRSIPDWELNSLRQSLPLIIISSQLMVTRTVPSLPHGARWYVAVSAVLMTLDPGLYFASVDYLPLSLLNCIRKTIIIIFANFIYAVFLKETITWPKVIATMLCLIGILLSIQPWQLDNLQGSAALNHGNISQNESQYAYNVESHHQTENVSMPNAELNTLSDMFIPDSLFTIIVFGYCFVIVSGVLEVFVQYIYKYMDTKDIMSISKYIWQFLFWVFLSAAILSTIVMLLLETPKLPSDWTEVTLILGHSATYFLSYFLGAQSLSRISGSVYNIVWNSSTIILMLIAQYTLTTNIQPGHRNWMEVSGAMLVLVGSAVSIIPEIRP